jgi:hypothetical protein
MASLSAIGPLVLFSLTFIVVCFYILKQPTARTLLGYSALVGVSAALINSAIDLANVVNIMNNNYGEYSSVSPSYYVFEAIYYAFSFVPGLIAFRRISRHKSNTFGTYNVYLGFLWSAIVLILGLVLTIMFAVVKEDYSDDTFIHMKRIAIFLNYCKWGFIAILWALHGIYFQDLKGKARNSFLTYTALNIFSATASAIMSSISFLDVGGDFEKILLIIFIVRFILCSIPVAIAFILVVHFGHLWNVDNNNAELNSVMNSEGSRIAEESTRRLNL